MYTPGAAEAVRIYDRDENFKWEQRLWFIYSRTRTASVVDYVKAHVNLIHGMELESKSYEVY